MSIFFNKRLFCFGGKKEGKDDLSLLNNCECFDFKECKWIKLSPMKYSRAIGNCLIYSNKIYVFGGVYIYIYID